MASKTSKKANAAAKGRGNAPIEKDDGTRWVIQRDGQQVYPGPGSTMGHATRLNEGLLVPGELVQVQ